MHFASISDKFPTKCCGMAGGTVSDDITSHPTAFRIYSRRLTLRSILPLLLRRMARARELRLTFSGLLKRRAITLRAPPVAAGGAFGLAAVCCWPIEPRVRRLNEPKIAP